MLFRPSGGILYIELTQRTRFLLLFVQINGGDDNSLKATTTLQQTRPAL
jgi:hypothetical protein